MELRIKYILLIEILMLSLVMTACSSNGAGQEAEVSLSNMSAPSLPSTPASPTAPVLVTEPVAIVVETPTVPVSDRAYRLSHPNSLL